jgi:hypothetical protein
LPALTVCLVCELLPILSTYVPQLFVALHAFDRDGSAVPVKRVVEAANMCHEQKAAFTQDVMARALQQVDISLFSLTLFPRVSDLSPLTHCRRFCEFWSPVTFHRLTCRCWSFAISASPCLPSQMSDQPRTPWLLMRSVLLALRDWPRLLPFVFNQLLPRLISRRIWDTSSGGGNNSSSNSAAADVWKGFVKVCEVHAGPLAFQALLQLPPDRLAHVAQKESAALGAAMRAWALDPRTQIAQRIPRPYLLALGLDVDRSSGGGGGGGGMMMMPQMMAQMMMPMMSGGGADGYQQSTHGGYDGGGGGEGDYGGGRHRERQNDRDREHESDRSSKRSRFT